MPRTNPNTYTALTVNEVSRILVNRAGVGKVDDIPTEWLVELAAAPTAEDRMLAARHRHTPDDTLAELARDTDRNVRCAVAVNTSAPPEILAAIIDQEKRSTVLSRFRDSGTRVDLMNAVAAHRRTDLDTLAKVIVCAGSGSAAGRYARERITLAKTREDLARRAA